MVQFEVAGLSKLLVKNRKLKLFWSGVLFFCFTCFIYHFYLQFERYFSYTKVTDTNQIDNGFRFPDVTICSTEPFDKERLQQQNVKKIQSDLLELWSSIFPDDTAALSANRFERQLAVWESAQHSMSLGVDTFAPALRQLEENLVFCQYQNKICSASNFSLYRHPVKQNCYTFRPSERQLTHPGENTGLFLILNMSGSASLMSPVEKLSHRVGYLVDLHPEGTNPQFESASFLAPINQQTNAEVSQSTIKDISTPIDRCQTDKRFIKVVSNFSTEPWSYNKFSQVLGDCRESEFQMQLEINCRCLDETLIISEPLRSRLCHALPDRLWDQMNFHPNQLTEEERNQIKTRAECYQKESDKFKNYILDIAMCYNPCNKLIYSKMISSNQWPNNYPVEEALQEILHSPNVLNFNFTEESGGMNTTVTNAPSSHLLALKIFPPTLTSVEIEKKREFEWVELVSEGSGIIGLWVGWCVFTVFEMIEYCVRKSLCPNDEEEEESLTTDTTPSLTTKTTNI